MAPPNVLSQYMAPCYHQQLKVFLKTMVMVGSLPWTFYFLFLFFSFRLHNATVREKALEVLHQKKFKWVKLNDDQLSQWYHPVDLCILNSTHRLKFPQDIRADDCKEFSRGSRRQFCGVGMGNNNYPCYGPFSTARPHFKEGVEGYTTFSSKPLIDLFTYFHLTDTTIMLLGDSTMRQKLQALTCELTRETNGHIRFNGDLFGIVPCTTAITFYFPPEKKFTYPELPSVFAKRKTPTGAHPLAGQSITIYAISIGPRSIECYSKLLKKEKKAYMNISNDYQFVNEGETTITPSKEHIETHGAYANAAYWTNEINLNQHRSILFLANMGLWYNDEEGYLKALGPVLEWLLSVGKRKTGSNGKNDGNTTSFHNIIAWHETLRQHWMNVDDTGYYNSRDAEAYTSTVWQSANYSEIPVDQFVAPFGCAKTKNVSDWRNDLMKEEYLKNMEYQKYFHLLPMAEITRYFSLFISVLCVCSFV
jgi:hypothetical protein